MGSISRHIMPLVINSLGDGHTHTHANTHTDVRTETISKIQVRAGLWPAHAWFKNSSLYSACNHSEKNSSLYSACNHSEKNISCHRGMSASEHGVINYSKSAHTPSSARPQVITPCAEQSQDYEQLLQMVTCEWLTKVYGQPCRVSC